MSSILGFRFPIITLKNKLTVVNYGSNHRYIFNTGEELLACSDQICKDAALIEQSSNTVQVIVTTDNTRFKLDINKDDIENWHQATIEKYPEYAHCKLFLDVSINYQITSMIQDDLILIAHMNTIDIILVPRPLMDAWSIETKMQKEIVPNLNEYHDNWERVLDKMKTPQVEDPVRNTIYSDRFCGNKTQSIQMMRTSNETMLAHE